MTRSFIDQYTLWGKGNPLCPSHLTVFRASNYANAQQSEANKTGFQLLKSTLDCAQINKRSKEIYDQLHTKCCSN